MTQLKDKPKQQGTGEQKPVIPCPGQKAAKIIRSTEGIIALGFSYNTVQETLAQFSDAKIIYAYLPATPSEPTAYPNKASDKQEPKDPLEQLQAMYPQSYWVIKFIGQDWNNKMVPNNKPQEVPIIRSVTDGLAGKFQEATLRIAGMRNFEKFTKLEAFLREHWPQEQPFPIAPSVALQINPYHYIIIQPFLENPTLEQFTSSLDLLRTLLNIYLQIFRETGVLLDFLGAAGAKLLWSQEVQTPHPTSPDLKELLPKILTNFKWDPRTKSLALIDPIAVYLPHCIDHHCSILHRVLTISLANAIGTAHTNALQCIIRTLEQQSPNEQTTLLCPLTPKTRILRTLMGLAA